MGLLRSHAVRRALRPAEDLLRLVVVAVWSHGQLAAENLFLRKQHARPYHVLLLVLASALLGGHSMWARGQIDTDAERRALVQRLTLDHASVMVAAQKQADERERALFADLQEKDRRLRSRGQALRQE